MLQEADKPVLSKQIHIPNATENARHYWGYKLPYDPGMLKRLSDAYDSYRAADNKDPDLTNKLDIALGAGRITWALQGGYTVIISPVREPMGVSRGRHLDIDFKSGMGSDGGVEIIINKRGKCSEMVHRVKRRNVGKLLEIALSDPRASHVESEETAPWVVALNTLEIGRNLIIRNLNAVPPIAA